jgi:carboxymethylenebutenolidase
MSRIDVRIPCPDGDCAATLHLPGGTGPWPAVLMFPDAGGVRGTFLDMADRMAGRPRLRDPAAERVPPARPVRAVRHAHRVRRPSGAGAADGHGRSVTAAMTIRVAGAYLAFLADRPEVAGAGVGTTGYCMGGRASLLVAGHHPDRVAAAASFHGGRLAAADDPDSPYLVADQVRAAVYVAAAENDPSCPPDQLQRLEKAYAEAGVRHTVETYPAAHGFAVPDNPTYDAAAGQRHWAALERLYGTQLSG